MLEYEKAKVLYEELEAGAAQQQDPFRSFYKMLLKSANEYAAARSSWAVMDQGERNADDRARRVKHDGFISLLDAVCRKLGMEQVEQLLPDRKTKGDFACYMALFMALEQR